MLKKLLLVSLASLGSACHLSAIVIRNDLNKDVANQIGVVAMVKNMTAKMDKQFIGDAFIGNGEEGTITLPAPGEYFIALLHPGTGAVLYVGGIDSSKTDAVSINQKSDGSVDLVNMGFATVRRPAARTK